VYIQQKMTTTTSTSTTTQQQPSLRFNIILNDGKDESFISLINLKEILARQLPKMPREYITRYVFDKQHINIICVANEMEIVGGVCFRPFPEQRFAEIAFLAVSSANQVQKVGSKLMIHLKEYARKQGLTHFLTYADNYALGYFKKQGFSSVVTLPKERWQGYIKDYDGGTLMECFIHPQINMHEMDHLIKRQRVRLLDLVHEQVRNNQLEQQQQVTWKFPSSSSSTPTSSSTSKSNILTAFQQVPGIKEAGWVIPVDISSTITTTSNSNNVPTTPSSSTNTTTTTISKNLPTGAALAEVQTALRAVVDRIINHRESWPFLEPVPDTVVDYFTIIKEPIDLSVIRKRINDPNQYVKDPAKLKRDLELMISNCKTYNSPITNYWKAAVGLEKFMHTLFDSDGEEDNVVVLTTSSSTPNNNNNPNNNNKSQSNSINNNSSDSSDEEINDDD
jgi:histone acetyltransferase